MGGSGGAAASGNGTGQPGLAPGGGGGGAGAAEEKLTGQRNENSVLFSLSALTSNEKGGVCAGAVR